MLTESTTDSSIINVTEKDFTKECCSIPPAKPLAEYVSKGEYITLDDGSEEGLLAYSTGDRSSKRGILVYHDIIGLHKNTEQSVDMLAAQGYWILMLDFFKGKPYRKSIAEWDQPLDRPAFAAYLQKIASWEIVAHLTNVGVEYFKSHGVESIGALGYCWGGKQVCFAATEKYAWFKGVAGVHPAGMTKELFEDITIPVCMIPTKTDPEMTEMFEAIKDRPFASKNVHERFDDMHHGFSGARANFDNSENAKRVADATRILADFFESTLV